MDYVTNNGNVVKEQKPKDRTQLVAYDMAFAKLKQSRKEKKNA